MIIAFLVAVVLVPVAYFVMEGSGDWTGRTGIKITPNLDDGFILGEFEDPADDLLRPLPEGLDFRDIKKALDIRKFSVKMVKYHPLSGIGLQPRLNLVFYFEGILPNPQNSSRGFSLPVMHVYLDVPELQTTEYSSEKVAPARFKGPAWDYQVILDGFHEQARIFDARGNLVGQGLGVYLHYTDKNDVPVKGDTTREVQTTRITAALPIKLLGDPSRGEWSYYVLLGLADSRYPSFLAPASNPQEPAIFDIVVPPEVHLLNYKSSPIPELFPLTVTN